MIHEPSIDLIANKIGSKYALCVLAAKRARQLLDHAKSSGSTELPSNEKPLSLAAQEIADGKVTATKF